jgi:hypothetical protein
MAWLSGREREPKRKWGKDWLWGLTTKDPACKLCDSLALLCFFS